MWTSAFEPILALLVRRVVGALAAVLVDAEGETVDYAGIGEAFDLRIAGAHMRLVLEGARNLRIGVTLGATLVVEAKARSYLVRLLPDGYAVVLLLRRRAARLFLPTDSRALLDFERALCAEAGWSRRPELAAWFPVRVRRGGDFRPLALISGEFRPRCLETLGTLVRLPPGHRGYRVRAAGGEELTLVREPGGHWYADEDPQRAG